MSEKQKKPNKLFCLLGLFVLNLALECDTDARMNI